MNRVDTTTCPLDSFDSDENLGELVGRSRNKNEKKQFINERKVLNLLWIEYNNSAYFQGIVYN